MEEYGKFTHTHTHTHTHTQRETDGQTHAAFIKSFSVYNYILHLVIGLSQGAGSSIGLIGRNFNPFITSS